MGNANGECICYADHDVDFVANNNTNRDANCYRNADGNKHNRPASNRARDRYAPTSRDRDSNVTSGDNSRPNARTNEYAREETANSTDKTGSAIEDESHAWRRE